MKLPSRKSPRLQGYDYSQNGAYFITICTKDKHCVLSRIAVGEGLAPPALTLLPFGKIADEQIHALEHRYPSAHVENYVIMPNHIHMIITLHRAGGASPSPATVSDVVRVFKSITTRLCKTGEPLFQRSFHDHIIRTEKDFKMIWEYIDNNPARWAEDRFYCE